MSRKLKYDRLLLFVLLCLLLLISFIYFIYVIFKPVNTEVSNSKVEVQDTKLGYNVTLNNYQIYNTGLKYNFALVDVSFSGNTNNLSINNIKTSEDIVLNDITKYIDYFKENNLVLDNIDYSNAINRNKALLFVPYSSNLTILLNDTKLEIDVSKNIKQAKFKTFVENNVAVGDVQYFTVSDGYLTNNIVSEEGYYSTNGDILLYQFNINVLNTNNLSIINGYYLDDSGFKQYLLDKDYKTENKISLFDGVISQQNPRVVFVEIAKDENVNSSGKLVFTLADKTTLEYEVKLVNE